MAASIFPEYNHRLLTVIMGSVQEHYFRGRQEKQIDLKLYQPFPLRSNNHWLTFLFKRIEKLGLVKARWILQTMDLTFQSW